MQFRRAIMTGLRGSFDFRGRMSRADYLPFLAVSALAIAALLLVGAMALDGPDFGWFALGTVALFYIPVTSAGCRRLRDAGEAPWLMLNPLKPAFVVALSFGLIALIAQTFLGFTALLLGLMFFAPVLLALSAIPALITLAMTGIYVSDTASRLLLPSAPTPFPLSKVQK